MKMMLALSLEVVLSENVRCARFCDRDDVPLFVKAEFPEALVQRLLQSAKSLGVRLLPVVRRVVFD